MHRVLRDILCAPAAPLGRTTAAEHILVRNAFVDLVQRLLLLRGPLSVLILGAVDCVPALSEVCILDWIVAVSHFLIQ